MRQIILTNMANIQLCSSRKPMATTCNPLLNQWLYETLKNSLPAGYRRGKSTLPVRLRIFHEPLGCFTCSWLIGDNTDQKPMIESPTGLSAQSAWFSICVLCGKNLIFLLFLLVLKQHPHRWPIHIIVLPAFHTPDKSNQKQNGDGKRNGDEENDDQHFMKLRAVLTTYVLLSNSPPAY